VTIKWTPDQHPDEDIFEAYAFDRFSGGEAAAFEEHLLVCERCQHTLAEADEYIRLMKAATAVYLVKRPAKRFLVHGLRRNAAAAALLLLTCLTALLSWRSPAGDAKTIALEAYRGAARATAPAGQPLDLKVDLREVKPSAGYRIEVVDANGRRVWFGGTPAHLTKGLAPGSYWVRLFTDGGELLREFGLTAG
jgi:hypothetical protein